MKIAKEYTTDAFTGRMVRPGEFYTQKAAQQQSQEEEKQKTQEKEVEQKNTIFAKTTAIQEVWLFGVYIFYFV